MACKAVWVKRILKDLGVPVTDAIRIFCKESWWMILCSGLDMTVCMCMCERERHTHTHKMYIDTENRIHKLMY